MIEVRTQAELDKAIEKTKGGKAELIVCKGDGYFELYGSSTVTASGSSTVTAYDSSTVRAYDSSTVTASGSSTVRAYDSSTVRAYDSSTVTASGSSTVRAYDSSTVRAYGSSTVRASGSSTVRAYGSSTVTAKPWTPVVIESTSKHVKVEGGQVIEIPMPTTAKAWCEFHDVEIRKGSEVKKGLRGNVAILFKALGDDFLSSNYTPAGKQVDYSPGQVPTAPDWDGGEAECGGGLHFSPSPHHGMEFNRGATKFVACPVKVADIAFHPDGIYPQKVKAPGCCAPTWEVDVDGNPT